MHRQLVTFKVDLEGSSLVMDLQKSAPSSVTLVGALSLDRKVVQKQVQSQSIVQRDINVGEVHVTTKKLKVEVLFKQPAFAPPALRRDKPALRTDVFKPTPGLPFVAPGRRGGSCVPARR